MTALNRVTPPAGEPVSLTEAKAHLRLAGSDEDALLNMLISAARARAEEYTGRSFMTQGWRLWLDAFPCRPQGWWDGVREGADLTVTRAISLPRAPVQAVTAVTLYDEDDVPHIFAEENYFADTASTPGRLALRRGASWPSVLRDANGISIEFTAGYGLAADVPAALKQGMLTRMAYLYEQRGDGWRVNSEIVPARGVPEAALVLYQPYRVHYLG
jgi:hypothetical protein